MLYGKLKDVVELACEKYNAGLSSVPKDVFTDPESDATLLLLACDKQLGKGWTAWEPETIWTELGDVADVNRDKIMAVAALDTFPAFYWDWRVMGNTCLTLCHKPVFSAIVPQPAPHHLAWGVFEAELLFALQAEEGVSPEHDDETSSYVAAVLYEAGFALAPDILAFCQPYLDALLSVDGRELVSNVKDEWSAHPKTGLEKASFEATALGVQMARLAEVHVYLSRRADALKKALTSS